MGIQQGVDLFGAEKVDVNAPSGAAQPDYRFYTIGSTLYHPFKVLGTSINLSSQFRFQWAETSLYSLDWFSNGGRYTVRGFASEDSLGAAHGWRFRNDFSTSLPGSPVSLYFGWDLGAVSGQGAKGLSKKELMGLTLGSKGGILGFQYDVFIARPFILYGPTAKNKCCESGINLSWRI
jgi:hemolysin activation/secretion protein